MVGQPYVQQWSWGGKSHTPNLLLQHYQPGTDDTTTNRPSQHRHNDITRAQLEPDDSNDDQNISVRHDRF